MKLVEKKKIAATILNLDKKIFIIHVAVLSLYREIIFRPDLFNGSGFYFIYLDLFRSALDLPPSISTGSSYDQIQPITSF